MQTVSQVSLSNGPLTPPLHQSYLHPNIAVLGPRSRCEMNGKVSLLSPRCGVRAKKRLLCRFGRWDFFNLRASAGRGAVALAVLGRAPEENVANFHIILPGAFQRERERASWLFAGGLWKDYDMIITRVSFATSCRQKDAEECYRGGF